MSPRFSSTLDRDILTNNLIRANFAPLPRLSLGGSFDQINLSIVEYLVTVRRWYAGIILSQRRRDFDVIYVLENSDPVILHKSVCDTFTQ